jgi:peptide/nickel transport system substrate-binding protein
VPRQITHRPLGPLADPVIEAVAQDLSAVGIKLNIKSEPTIQEWVSAYEAGTYPLTGFIENEGLSMYQFYHYYLSPGPGNPSSLGTSDDPTLDSLYAKGLTSNAPETIWQEMSARIVTQAEIIPIFENDAFWYAQKSVGGLDFSFASYYPLPTAWYFK